MDILERYRSLTPASAELFERARKLFPNGVCHNMRNYDPYPFYPTAASGALVRDVDGNNLIDLWMGHYSMILGHSLPEVRDAACEAMKGGWHWGMPAQTQVILGEELQRAVPMLEKMRFCCSGTEATMYAVRVARARTGRPWVLKAAGGWHGASTDLSFAVKPPFSGAEGPGLNDAEKQCIDHLTFNDTEASVAAIECHGDNLAAVIVEPMIGAGGFIPAKPCYLEALREACDRVGALLIFDEIITGFRFRYGILADEVGVKPDLVTLGKVLGGGFPIGVYGGSEEVMAVADPSVEQPSGAPALVGGGTFSCNPVTMFAALTTLVELKAHADTLYPTLARRGEAVREGVVERFAAAGVRACVTGHGSLFMAHILKGDDDVIECTQHIHEKTHSALPDRELKLSLINNGVFTVHGGGSLSSAHDEEIVHLLLEAYGKSAEEILVLL